MFSSTWLSSSSTTSQSFPDTYDLAEEYGKDAAAQLSGILQALETAGFPKAHINSYSAFDRVLSGITWLFQQLVRREDAEKGRVQWDVLFQSHDKMKPRLGLAQEVVRCIEALSYGCPISIRPHQLLLQDFGDIETVQKLVMWLIEEVQTASPYLEKIRREGAYLKVINLQEESRPVAPLIKKEVAFLLSEYVPKRRWQYLATDGNEEEEDEDALIQRCLFEYGERMMLIGGNKDKEGMTEIVENGTNKSMNLMAEIASQAAAIASSGGMKLQGGSNRTRPRRNPRWRDVQVTDFDQQFQKATKQAMKIQQDRLNQRRKRETELLQRVISAPEEKQAHTEEEIGSNMSSSIHLVKAKLKEHELQVQQLRKEKKELNATMKACHAQTTALDEALAAVKLEMKEVEAQVPKDANTQEQLVKLTELMQKYEELKHEKNEFRVKCRSELALLKEQIEKIKLQVADDVNKEDEVALRFTKIEKMHAQMAQKHKEAKLAAATQTRAVQVKMKKIDEIPSRIELVQYEKRLMELYDEVALTLDETRKYYCVYNTIKTTHEYLEKEISLINSISENFDAAMSSKIATQAFFVQMEYIIQSIQDTFTKQQTVRDDHQLSVETLEGKYQMLLEHERKYVNAIRAFQKECEKNENLLVKLQELA